MADVLWTIAHVLAAVGAEPGAIHEGTVFSGVSIDSRTLTPADLFFAIKGEKTDGHLYVQSAIANGAAAAVVSRDFTVPDAPATPLLKVDDPLLALNALGIAARKRMSGTVTGVTGSVGKTGTKEMLRLMFSACGKTHASEKSYNNLWGVPLSLARMPQDSRFGVFEMGMNHANEIRPLTKMVRPHIAIVTTVAPVHIEFFESVAGIADAKAEIFEGVEAGGYAILPQDNEHYERLRGHASNLGLKTVSFGESATADCRLATLDQDENGSIADAVILGQAIRFNLPAPGRHLAVNALAGLAAVSLAGADVTSAAAALDAFTVPEGRGGRHHLSLDGEPLLLIDESYNANPASMRAALQVLAALPLAKYTRRIAVLGDMLELGNAAQELHANLAPEIASNSIDLVFCAGPNMHQLYHALPQAKRGAFANSADQLAGPLLQSLKGGDAVMVKGSLGSRMSLLVKALQTNFPANTLAETGKHAA